MDFDQLLQRNWRSLLGGDTKMNLREKRAHDQFAREFVEQMKCTRDVLDEGRSQASEKKS